MYEITRIRAVGPMIDRAGLGRFGFATAPPPDNQGSGVCQGTGVPEKAR